MSKCGALKVPVRIVQGIYGYRVLWMVRTRNTLCVVIQNVRQPEGGNTLSREILCMAGVGWLEGINQKGGKWHANGPMQALNKYQIELWRL